MREGKMMGADECDYLLFIYFPVLYNDFYMPNPKTHGKKCDHMKASNQSGID